MTTRPKGWRLFKAAIGSRKAATMLAFGFASGLPFALLVGTLTAWLGDAKINLATIGVLSWIGLSYAFKFLWSPLVDRGKLPLLERLGRRKSWIALCQGVIVLALLGLVATDPTIGIGRFALFAFIAALGSATQDMAIDGWRIDVSDETTTVELLSAIYQLGYRTASIVGGAIALLMAAQMSWPAVYLAMAVLMAVLLLVTLTAPDTPRPDDVATGLLAQPGELNATMRGVALAVVGIAWAWAIVTILAFMARMLGGTAPGETPPSVGDFLKLYGPLIVFATVLVPLGVGALVNWYKARGRHLQVTAAPAHGTGRAIADHLYGALVAPVADLAARLRWGVLIVIGLILTYALCYNIWASFAYPFYLDFMHYSKEEVAFASKIFGIVMSIIGVSLGGYLFVRIGRFPTVLIGAAFPIFGNFIYADLAEGAPHIDMVLHATHLDALVMAFGGDMRMARLLLTICYENISTGLAGAAFVAYISTIVSKKFPAVQYALLSSLTFLIGSLSRGVAGEMIERVGYATVFREVAMVGLLAIVFVLLEWGRASAVARRAEPGDTGQAA
jgi:PAT family beta-lactamase induction signal transducer AmpG